MVPLPQYTRSLCFPVETDTLDANTCAQMEDGLASAHASAADGCRDA